MRSSSTGRVAAATVAALVLASDRPRAAEPPRLAVNTPLVVTADLELDPAGNSGPLVIKASNITIDGHGATIRGAEGSEPNTLQGDGILAEGVSGVTLRNVKVHGFETGLHIADGSGWTVDNCDFSDNFTDPAFGWGENGRRGGILLERVDDSRVRNCRANRVWDACCLVDSDGNLIDNCDFSHTSDTCLKLWHSTGNTFRGNNLSYGIRKDPGEVHARDSTSVLIESGSDRNRFLKNDCTHGGDGIFVRVLNGWISSHNVFEDNDCSFANNNCIEAWSPENTWLRNKANHGSYGFWLGASDKNVLIDNEASFNGLPEGHHNSPHLPDEGHAGIVFMFGPSSHTLLRGNRCEGNNGAGIAAIGDLESQGRKWNAFHWVVEQNSLTDNRWGIYLQHAETLYLAANVFSGNSQADVFDAGGVADLQRGAAESTGDQPPRAKVDGPVVVRAGQPAVFDASASSDPSGKPLSFHWRMQPSAAADGAVFAHVFDQPGYNRLGLTVSNGVLADLAWRDVYVVQDVRELGTENAVSSWSAIDPDSTVEFHADREHVLVGEESLRADIKPYGGGRVTLVSELPSPQKSREGSRIRFWLKTRNENVPAWQDVNPLITLTSPRGTALQLIPVRDFLSDPPYIEAREGWTYFDIPVDGDTSWRPAGNRADQWSQISLGFDSWGAPPLVIWIDGLSVD